MAKAKSTGGFFGVVIGIEKRRSPDLTVREMARAKKAALRELPIWWWDKILPKHFTAKAKGLYDYTPRTKGYEIRKAKRMGHRDPLVWSGGLRDAMTSRAPRVSGSSKGATARFTGLPRYTYAYHKDPGAGGTQDKKDELTRVNQPEALQMARRIREHINLAAAAAREHKKVK